MGALWRVTMTGLMALLAIGCRPVADSGSEVLSEGAGLDRTRSSNVGRAEGLEEIQRTLAQVRDLVSGPGSHERLGSLYDQVYPTGGERPEYEIPDEFQCESYLSPLEREGAASLGDDGKGCLDQLLDPMKGAIGPIEYFLNSEQQFDRMLAFRMPQSIRDISTGPSFHVPADKTKEQVEASLERAARATLARLPTARVVVLPTVHFKEGTKTPLCFSMTLELEELKKLPDFQINRLIEREGQDGDQGYYASERHWQLELGDGGRWKDFYRLDYMASLIPHHQGSHTLLGMVPLHEDAPDVDALLDGDLPLTCGAGESCVIFRGKDLESKDDCPAFQLTSR